MSAESDAILARLLHSFVNDLLAWMGDYPDDQVNPQALASIRQSVDWVLEQLPARHRDPLASDDSDPAVLATVTGLLVDIVWWLDTCVDSDVDPDLAVKLLESVAADIAGLSGSQRRRLLKVIGYLAASEHHDGRRYELRFFPYAVRLVDDEPEDEEPPARRWVPPEIRAVGSAAIGEHPQLAKQPPSKRPSGSPRTS